MNSQCLLLFCTKDGSSPNVKLSTFYYFVIHNSLHYLHVYEILKSPSFGYKRPFQRNAINMIRNFLRTLKKSVFSVSLHKDLFQCPHSFLYKSFTVHEVKPTLYSTHAPYIPYNPLFQLYIQPQSYLETYTVRCSQLKCTIN